MDGAARKRAFCRTDCRHGMDAHRVVRGASLLFVSCLGWTARCVVALRGNLPRGRLTFGVCWVWCVVALGVGKDALGGAVGVPDVAIGPGRQRVYVLL